MRATLEPPGGISMLSPVPRSRLVLALLPAARPTSLQKTCKFGSDPAEQDLLRGSELGIPALCCTPAFHLCSHSQNYEFLPLNLGSHSQNCEFLPCAMVPAFNLCFHSQNWEFLLCAVVPAIQSVLTFSEL